MTSESMVDTGLTSGRPWKMASISSSLSAIDGVALPERFRIFSARWYFSLHDFIFSRHCSDVKPSYPSSDTFWEIIFHLFLMGFLLSSISRNADSTLFSAALLQSDTLPEASCFFIKLLCLSFSRMLNVVIFIITL